MNHVKRTTAAVVMIICLLTSCGLRQDEQRSDELPVITPYIHTSDISHMAYDISELENGNPWTADTELETLPVYKNLAFTEELGKIGIEVYLTEEQAKDAVQSAADALGVEITDTKTTNVSHSTKGYEVSEGLIYCYEAYCDGSPLGIDSVELLIYGNGELGISFNDNLKLPDEYAISDENADAEDIDRLMTYLADRFSALINYENPVSYTIADRNIDGEKSISFYLYDEADDCAQSMINYSLCRSVFSIYNGELSHIWLNNPLDAAEYVGDYPIITMDEAQELLISGKYLFGGYSDTSGDGKITADMIGKAELVYPSGSAPYLMPYYRFYIDQHSDEWYTQHDRIEGLRDFDIILVPAINAEYLTDFDTWDWVTNM